MAIKLEEIKKLIQRNVRLSICFLDGHYHNYLLVSDIPSSEYDDFYVYGVGMTDVEFSMDIYSEPEEPNGEVSISMSNLTMQPAIEIVLSDKPRDIGQVNHMSIEKTFQKNMTTCMCMALEWRESLTIRKEWCWWFRTTQDRTKCKKGRIN